MSESNGEQWRLIPGLPWYEASDAGRIRSHRSNPPRVLFHCVHKGYQHVQLKTRPGDARHKLPVHRLVLLAFKGPPPPGHITRHLNGERFDNRLDNLAWGTASENARDAVRHGTAAGLRRGGQALAAKLTDEDYTAVLRRIADGQPFASIARHFGIHRGYVGQIAAGRGRKASPALAV